MRTVSVKQVNEYIARRLKDDMNLRNLAVVGEISGLSRSGPHMYLTLKDADSLIRCAIWGSYLTEIDKSLLKNGTKVIAICDISPYPKGGSYSLSIRQLEEIGIGDYAKEFDRIKKLLMKEGMFEPAHKRPLNPFPERIGIVTSDTGAAVEDIKKIITSKNNYTHILIFPTQVQGIGAPASIIENIRLANRLNSEGLRIDTLIVGRGGGSQEDLMAFNDEGVARAVYASDIPVISAVGHESDVSITDFVADVRAETPTAAADMAVPDTESLKEMIDENSEHLERAIGIRLERERNTLKDLTSLLGKVMQAKLSEARLLVEKAAISISENGPERIMEKGYGAVLDFSGRLIHKAADINEGEEYRIVMKGGSFKVKVVSKEISNEG